MAKNPTDLGRCDPLVDPTPGSLVPKEAGYGAEGDARTPEQVTNLRNRALTAVDKPGTRIECLMIHAFGGLEIE